MRNRQHRYADDRNRSHVAQLSSTRVKIGWGSAVVVEDEVDRTHKIGGYKNNQEGGRCVLRTVPVAPARPLRSHHMRRTPRSRKADRTHLSTRSLVRRCLWKKRLVEE